ncbi:hypothetical protein GJ744_008449 [Endocarpon pusillum]|uniref:Shelterin complex subunit TPP1/Est3 domain-containing protein n=1 Tax=Endocarpon pusillum TaxID=364733 RepID=A0A8H7AJ19_9EURO|nr:hypothetical protein GJ744_008449 [Endocarpon pusillum]
MHRLTEWVEPLLAEGLGQYISSKNATSLTQDSKQHCSIVEELSNLCIRPLTDQYLVLVDLRSSEGDIEAILADSAWTIEAVFPRYTVKRWQTKSRSLHTSFPAGTLFQISKAELRVSDCFLPPRIELWVHSFEIVGDLGNEIPSVTREIGASPDLERLLKSYAELHNHKNTQEDTIIMGSPLRSQESSCSSKVNCEGIDETDVSEMKNMSQPFDTQISPPLATKHRRHPLTPTHPRSCSEIMSNEMVSIRDTSPLLVASKSVQSSIARVEDPVNRVEPIPNQLSAKVPSHNSIQGQQGSSLSCANPVAEALGDAPSVSKNRDHWPGGRTPLTNGRFLPRYTTKLSKEQQQVLETANAWQPSKEHRQIRGSLPNPILKIFTELADKVCDEASTQRGMKDQVAMIAEARAEGDQLKNARDSDRDSLDRESNGSGSPVSICPSWSATPRSPAIRDPAFPENSSPLQAQYKRVAPSVSRCGSPNASLGSVTQGCQIVENKSSVNSQEGKSIVDATEFSRDDESAAVAQKLSQSPQGTIDSANSKRKREGDSLWVSPEQGLPQDGDQEQFQTIESFRPLLVHSSADEFSQRDPILTAPHTQHKLNHQTAGGKALIHVQRTPFVPQTSSLIGGPDVCEHQAIFPYKNADEPVANDQEPRSSTSVVAGTCIYPQAEPLKQSEVGSRMSLHGGYEHSKDEQMEVEVVHDIIPALETAGSLNATFDAPSSSPNPSISSPEERPSDSRLGKRKYCNDDYGTPTAELAGSTDDRRAHLNPVLSKRLRRMSKFPSLEALKDLSTVRAPSEIARESRREFFWNQQNVVSGRIPILDETDKRTPSHDAYAKSREVSRSMQQRHTTQNTGLTSRKGMRPESGVNTISHLSLRGERMYKTYKATYPKYQGTALHFHKACKQIEALHREGKAPHPSLWDDFIFRRHHDYRDYLMSVTEACEDALPYLQYYTEHVEKPSCMQLVVKASYILSLGTDSALGSSVKSPSVVAQNHGNAANNLEDSVAVSSSASNVEPAQHINSPTVACGDGNKQDMGYELNSYDRDEAEPTQESSVKQWVEMHSMDKMTRMESPELGSPVVATRKESNPQQVLDDAAEVPVSSSLEYQPAVLEHKEKELVWCDDPNTPFKTFARNYATLASERKQVKGSVEIGAKGCLEPKLQNLIDIFTLYKK